MMMDSPVNLQKVKKSLTFLDNDIDSSTTPETSFSKTCRYNLRNRGPAKFAVLVGRECPICLSDVFEKPVVVNCGHTFCDKCIQLSLVKYKNCPMCNQVLIKSLFLSDTSYTMKLTKKTRSPKENISMTRLGGRTDDSGVQQTDGERGVTNRDPASTGRRNVLKLREKRKAGLRRTRV